MRAAQFAKNTLEILGTKIGNLVVSFLFSVLLARLLGPEGKGTYSLVLLFSSLFVTFLNFGLGPAIVYLTASGSYSRKTIVGNSHFLFIILGVSGMLIGFVILLFAGESIYPEIPRQLLFLSLLLIPISLYINHLAAQYLLGINKIGSYNLTSFGSVFLPFLSFLFVILLIGPDLTAVVWSRIIGLALLAVFLLFWFIKSIGKISLSYNLDYIKDLYQYGIKAYFGNVIGFLNYRVEVFLLGYFLPLSAVGYYSVAVGLAEMLWLVSQSAGTLIFPMISAEKDEQKKKYITPLVARTVFGVTVLGAAVLFVVSDWLVPLVYSTDFNPSISLLWILLPGVSFLSGSRVLANDIAGRGKPILNTYVGGAGFILQVIVNLSLIPLLGAVGAAWASTIAYLFLLILRVGVYLKVSGNDLCSVILPQKGDWDVYKQVVMRIWKNLSSWFVESE